MSDAFGSFLSPAEEHAQKARAALLCAVDSLLAVLGDKRAAEWLDAAEWYDSPEPEWRVQTKQALRLLQDVERQMARSLGIVK